MIDKSLLARIQGIEILAKKLVTNVFAGDYESAFKGRGIEFEEVRPYQIGDDIRTIDWNVTARMDEAYIKTYREERELTVYLLIDLSASGHYGTFGKTKNRTAAEISAVLSLAALRNNDKVGLIAFTDRVELFIPPEKTDTHAIRIVREIMGFSPESPKTSIEAALDYFSKMQKHRSIVVLVSDFLDTGYEQKLKLVAMNHELVCLHITDPGEGELPRVGLIQTRDLETGSMRLINAGSRSVRDAWKSFYKERMSELKKSMAGLNIDYLTLSTKEDWVRALTLFFIKRNQRSGY